MSCSPFNTPSAIPDQPNQMNTLQSDKELRAVTVKLVDLSAKRLKALQLKLKVAEAQHLQLVANATRLAPTTRRK